MLSEGWDAKNVTHIMGLRAFTVQLLCEQVIGRGLRRVSYDTDDNGLFLPEYVNVFGVPLSISDRRRRRSAAAAETDHPDRRRARARIALRCAGPTCCASKPS